MKHFFYRSLVALCLYSTAGFIYSQSPDAAPFPGVALPKVARGADVVTALGLNLPAVARWYGHTEADFRKLCARERSLAADRSGHLFYACAGMVANATTGTGAGTAGAAAYPESQTFLLHSKTWATRVIYLDFDGNTASGTQ